MRLIPISEPGDPALARFRLRDPQLHPGAPADDAPTGLFVAEGDLVVERALRAGYRPEAVLAATGRPIPVLELLPAGTPVYTADAALRRELTGLLVALDVIGLFHRGVPPPAEAVIADATRLVVVQEVDNPTNLGVIARSAAALGVDGLLVDPTSADPLARRCARVSMGAVFALPHSRIGPLPRSLDPLRRAGFRLLALTPDRDALPLDSVSIATGERAAVLLGSERAGLSAEVLASCEPVCVPMRSGFDSLNVAAAAAIAFYVLGAA